MKRCQCEGCIKTDEDGPVHELTVSRLFSDPIKVIVCDAHYAEITSADRPPDSIGFRHESYPDEILSLTTGEPIQRMDVDEPAGVNRTTDR